MTNEQAALAKANSLRVRKVSGYRWPGYIVAAFTTLSGEFRVVVECDVPAVRGALHIYSPAQLEVIEDQKPQS